MAAPRCLLSELELKLVPLIGQGRGTRQIAEALHLKREDRGEPSAS